MQTLKRSHGILGLVAAAALLAGLLPASAGAQVPDFLDPAADNEPPMVDSGPPVDPTMNPEDALREALVQIAIAEKKEEGAEEAMNRAAKLAGLVLSRDPLNPTAGYIAGRVGILTNRPREALPLLEAYINDPAGRSDWYAHKLIGDIYLVSYPKHARGKFERAVALAPREPEAVIGLAKADLKELRAASAVKHAEQAILLDQTRNASYRLVLAEALLTARPKDEDAASRAREAVLIIEENIRQDPGDETLLGDLKDGYSLLIQALRNLSTVYPEKPEYVVQMALAMQDRADLEKLLTYHGILKYLDASVTQLGDRANADILYEQARLNRLVGRDAEAMRILERVLEMSPNHEPGRELLETLLPQATAARPSPSQADAFSAGP